MSGYMGQHKPLPDGRCEHRWRSRQTRVVSCAWADGYRAGLGLAAGELSLPYATPVQSLLRLARNRQMPDHSRLTLSLGELRSALAWAAARLPTKDTEDNGIVWTNEALGAPR